MKLNKIHFDMMISETLYEYVDDLYYLNYNNNADVMWDDLRDELGYGYNMIDEEDMVCYLSPKILNEIYETNLFHY